MRCAIYIRVSTKKQTEKYGLLYQERLCKSLIASNGWIFTKTYEDRGISGTLGPDKRKGLEYLLEDAEYGLFDKVIIYSLDRIGRSRDIINNILNQLNNNNIFLISYTQNLCNNIDNHINISCLELKTIKSRLAMGREQKKLESGYIGGSLPYGYSRIDGKISINPAHADIVRSIYVAYHDKKFSLRKISRCLTNENIEPPRKGSKGWNNKSIAIILDNKEKYEGCVINNNENNIRWPIILNYKYPVRNKRKYSKLI